MSPEVKVLEFHGNLFQTWRKNALSLINLMKSILLMANKHLVLDSLKLKDLLKKMIIKQRMPLARVIINSEVKIQEHLSLLTHMNIQFW